MSERHHPDRQGELVGGKYRLTRFLAEGGMGAVYEAQHAVVKRRFAIKFLHPDLAKRREILTRFQREAEAAGALENENVAAAVDFGIADDGTPYIVMEYLVGENLAELLARERRLPIERATDLVVQACRGIQAAHAAGVVHRDLKPQNLFLCRRQDGTDLTKVLDFGVAKLQAIDETSLATRTGSIMGTAAYMAPEQARGEKAIDHRADVYALGAILYELLSSRKPHVGDSHNALLYHISTQPSVPLDSVAPNLPLPLVEVVERALSSDPGDRFESAEALGDALARFARRQVWPEAKERTSIAATEQPSSTLLSPLDPARPGAGSIPVSSLDTRDEPRPGRHRVGRAVVLGAIVALPVALAATWSSRRVEPHATTPERDALSRAAPEPFAEPAASRLPDPAPRTREEVPVEQAPPVAKPAAAITPPSASGRPSGRPARRPTDGSASAVAMPSASAPTRPASDRQPMPFTFDPHNPYN